MKAYEGVRTEDGCTVTVDGRAIDMRMDLRKHADRPEWGYSGGGPAQLALAILADAVGDEVALDLHQKFKRKVISQLPREEWTLTQADVRSMLDSLLRVHSLPHDFDEDGEHDYECQSCIEATESVESECRCGECCKLLLEVSLRDAEREPKIREIGLPILSPPQFGPRELMGYILPNQNGACAFLDASTKSCTIYKTRPTACRVFDCDGEGRQQLIELGWLQRQAPEDGSESA